jgi:ubiquinone/menaquinone biosynthesis C-methylase UbiE
MGVMDAFYGQFKRPTGVLGSAVGHLMALKNRARGRWVIERLGLQTGMRVLEVGCGPGADAAHVLSLLGTSGSYVGVDASDVMVRQASARNRGAVRRGRASFVLRDISDGLELEPTFDVGFSINCAQFWPNLDAGLAEMRRVIRQGGRIVVAVQPRNRGATEDDSARWSERLSAAALRCDLTILEAARGATSPSTVALVLDVRAAS